MNSPRYWTACALALALLACAPAASPPGGAVAPAPSSPAGSPATSSPSGSLPPAAPRKVEVVMATISATCVPIWIGVDQGLFQKHGLEVEATSMAAASATQALTAGSVPLAITGASTVGAWLGGATDLVFVAGLENKASFKVIGRPEIARVDDLRGKAVGGSTGGSGASIALIETLRRAGLELDRDYSISYLREQPARLAGLLGGAVDAAVLSVPFTEQAAAQGMRQLVDMRDLNLDLLTISVTTTRGLVAREPELVRAFLMAYVESVQLLRDQPALAVEAIMRGTRTSDRAAAEAAYDEVRAIVDIWPSEASIQILLDYSDAPTARTTRPAEMIDLGPLRELERNGWLAAHYRDLQ